MKNFRAPLAALLLLAASFPAMAEGFFLGLTYGNTSPKDSWVKDDKGLLLNVGYGFSDSFAVELSKVDLGEFSLTTSGLSGFSAFLGETVTRGSFDVGGLALSGVATLPLGEKAGLNFRFGMFRWDYDLKLTIDGWGSGTADDSGTDFLYGIGFGYKLTDSFAASFEWTKYDIDEFDVQLLGLGLRYTF